MRTNSCILAAGLLASAAMTTTGFADVSAFALGRYANYSQTSDDQPLSPFVYNVIGVLVSEVNNEVISSSMSFDRPPLVRMPLTQAIPTLWYCGSTYYEDYNEFIAAYPATTYTFTANRGFGPETGEVYIAEDLFCPEIPYFTGDTWTRLQNMDASTTFVATINGFTLNPGTSEGYTSIIIAEDGQPGSVMSIVLAPDETTFEIPAGTLHANGSYSIGVTYLNQERIWNAGFGGNAVSGAEFYRATGARFTTAPEPCTPTWTQAAPLTTAPSRRMGGSMTYDSARDRTVMFGGGLAGNTRSNQTWEWDGFDWHLRAVGGPSPRGIAPFVYDSARGVSVLIGGWNETPIRDTWEWNGTSWNLRSTVGPSLRHFATAAYDAARAKTVYFGGYQVLPNQYMNDTWEWNGITWTQRVIPGPPARDKAAMAYDNARHRIVLFGGSNGTQYFGDTWEFDGVSWIMTVAESPSGPAPRAAHQMVFDSNRARIVMYGGGTSTPTFFGDSWDYDGTEWSRLAYTGPAPRVNPGMAYDSRRNQAILFGGNVGSPGFEQDDTWILTAGPVISSHPQTQSLLAGDSAQFAVAATSLTPLTYQWRKDGSDLVDDGIISGANTDTLTISSITLADAGSYDVVVSNDCGGLISLPALLSVTDLCPADFNHDQVVDFFDYLDFVDAFASNQPAADFNHDEVIDFFDYLDFVDAFSSGC